MEVFVVMKNTDFTEGRGPMVIDRAYTNRTYAHDYIMAQEGIYGSPQRYEPKYDSYNGYSIRTLKVLDTPPEEERKHILEAELANIEAERKKILNKLGR